MTVGWKVECGDGNLFYTKSLFLRDILGFVSLKFNKFSEIFLINTLHDLNINKSELKLPISMFLITQHSTGGI